MSASVACDRRPGHRRWRHREEAALMAIALWSRPLALFKRRERAPNPHRSAMHGELAPDPRGGSSAEFMAEPVWPIIHPHAITMACEVGHGSKCDGNVKAVRLSSVVLLRIVLTPRMCVHTQSTGHPIASETPWTSQFLSASTAQKREQHWLVAVAAVRLYTNPNKLWKLAFGAGPRTQTKQSTKTCAQSGRPATRANQLP